MHLKMCPVATQTLLILNCIVCDFKKVLDLKQEKSKQLF